MTRTWQTIALALCGALTMVPGPARAEKSDADFVAHAASDGMLEVQLGTHAWKNAVDPAVQQFGERMMRDHQQVGAQLESVAEKAGLSVPDTMEAEHRKQLQELTALEGAEFDRRYMDAMVKGHEKDVQAFRQQAAGDSAVDRWARETLPTLEEHLALAREVQAQTRGAALPPEAERTSTR